MAIAISTSWRPDEPPGSLLDELAQIEAPALALASNLHSSTITRLKQRERIVLVVWLYAERPEGMPPGSDPLQTLPLATPDREMQSRALKQAVRSLRLATDLEAPVLVAPLLSPQGLPTSQGLDAARRALDPLLEEGMRRGVRVALPLEGEIVSSEEVILSLLQDFSGAPLAYWHRGVYQEETPAPEPLETLSPGGILLLTPPAAPPPAPPEVPLLPPSLEAVCAGASVTLPPPPEGDEPWPEGAWCQKLKAALGGKPLVYEPEPERTPAEIERVFLWLQR